MSIKRGTEIFAAKPFVFTLTSKQIENRCDNCLKSGKLFKCSACQYVSYCGRICQKEAWLIHKQECPNLKRISPKVLPDTARLMARIIIKLNQGGNDEVGYYTKSQFRKFKDLMSHYSDIKKHDKRMEHFTCLCGILLEYLADTTLPNTAELMGIYGRICINAFDILDSDVGSIGVGIYLGPSIMDHSCQPNAVFVFEGSTIIIRTIQDLPCLDWTQVKISYIDVLGLTKDRRQELQESYYFLCDCARCKDPLTEEGAAACQNATCACPCTPEAAQCPECGHQFPNNFKETFKQVSEFTAHHLQTMKDVAYLDVSKICLKKQEGVLHRLNVQRVKTVEAAFEASLNLQCWEDARFYATQLVPGYLHYYGEVHPLVGKLYLMKGKIELHLNRAKDALYSLKKAETILAVTHGEKHSLVRESLRPLLFQATVESR